MRWRGFTLIEVVVVLIILGILVAFVAPVLSLAVNSYDYTSRNIEVLTKMRYTMERIAREIRAIRRDPLNVDNYDVVTGSMTATKFEFCRADGTRVTIDNATLSSAVALGYTTGFTSTCTSSAATTQTLTDSVTSFSLTYLTITGAAATGKTDVAYVDIALTLTGTGTTAYSSTTSTSPTYSSTMRVDMRNP